MSVAFNRANRTIYTQFVGQMIKDGKKTVAKRIVDEAFMSASRTLKMPPQLVLLETYNKLNTVVEVKTVKLGGQSHVVPFAVSFKRRSYLVVKWTMDAMKHDKRRVPAAEKLALELVNIVKEKQSRALQLKKQNTELAMLNRANIHFRW